MGVTNNITQTSCNYEFGNRILLLILVKDGNIIGSTQYIPIDNVTMVNVYGKYSSIEYQGIVWVSETKVTSVLVSDNSIAMYLYAI